jgi:hypothetical protein
MARQQLSKCKLLKEKEEEWKVTAHGYVRREAAE